MPSQGLGLAPRLRYLAWRARRIDVGSVVERAKEASQQHGKWTPAVVVDMLWQAGFRNVGFQDYIDYDFAILNRAERATYMTHPVSNQLSQKYDHPDFRGLFQDKVEFDRVFTDHLHREWMVVEEGNAEAVRAFAERHGTIVTKEPVGQAGTGVHRYHAADIDGLGWLPPRPARARRAAHRRGHRPARRPRGGLPGNGQHHPGDGLLRRREDAHPRDGAEVRTRRGERPDDVRRLLHDARRERPRRRPGLRLARARPRDAPRQRLAHRRLPAADDGRGRSSSSTGSPASSPRCSTSAGTSSSPPTGPCSSRATGARACTRTSPASPASAPATSRATARPSGSDARRNRERTFPHARSGGNIPSRGSEVVRPRARCRAAWTGVPGRAGCP